MCDQTEIPYKHGDVVWVKFGKCFWPGQVVGLDKLPEDVSDCLKKDPIAVVQFFDEDQYEFVKNLDHISLYNGRRKLEFIKKGLDLYRNQKGKSTFMSKFPEDVKKAELLTGGNPNVLTDPQLTPKEKSSYQGLFDGNKTSPKKEKGTASPKKRGRPPLTSKANGRKSSAPVTPVHTPRPITHPRFVKGEADHDVRIRDQSAAKVTTPEADVSAKPKSDAAYKCHLCDFTSTRVNVIVLHSKFHSGEVATPVKGKGSAGKNKTSTTKARSSLSSTATKARANAKTKAVIEVPKAHTEVSSSVSSSSKPVTTPKPATKRKLVEDTQKDDDKSSPTKAKVKTKEIAVKNSAKSQQKLIDKKSSKVTTLGKRKSNLANEKATKKSRNDEEIREQLLADWDDEDAEQERKELEELEELKKKKMSEERVTKEVSCFDFDDSKDAILDNELEERAKKFVESRKVPREKVENSKEVSPQAGMQEDAPAVANAEADSASPEDFDKAINSLLAETVVPELPQVPSGLLPDVVLDSSLAAANESKIDTALTGEHDYSARKLDVDIEDDVDMLDINSMPVVMTDDIITEEPSTSRAPLVEMPKIDLVPNADLSSTPAIVFSQEEIKMPTSVKSAVKAVRASMADQSKVVSKAIVSQSNMKPAVTTTITRKLAPMSGAVSKGIAAGKYIIVQSSSGQNSRLQLAPTSNPPQQLPGKVTVLSKPPQKALPSVAPRQQKLLTISSPSQQKLLTTFSPGQKVLNVTSAQQKCVTTLPSGHQKVLTITPKQQKFVTATMSGQQKVITVTPKQQKVLTVVPAQQKLMTGMSGKPQLLMTSSGQILTPVTQKGALPAGAKFAPVRALTPGKQGPRLAMQSLQTKVCLPTMRPVRASTAPGMRVISTASPQANTILIQATQSGAAATAPRLIRSQVSPAAMTQTTKTMQAALRPKILQSRSTIQPRMVVQKPNTTMGIVSNVQQVSGLVTQPQVIQKITQPAANTRLISQPKKTIPTMTRVVASQPKPAVTIPQQPAQYTQLIQKATAVAPTIANNVELIAAPELPPLAPLQSSSMPAGNVTLTLPQGGGGLTLPNFQTCSVATTGSTGLTSEQLAQVMASPQVSQMGDAGAAGTYVFLTIDEAGNLQYNNNHLISYDATDGTSQTLYIDSSSLESGGDLDNMILRIDNSGSVVSASGGGELNLGDASTSWMPSTSQDILAAALANTDVFQPETSLQDSCVVDTSSLLSSIPSTLLMPSLNRVVTTAANVSETSLTLNQPIMSPLEVTSSSATSFRAPPPHVSPSPLNVTSIYPPSIVGDQQVLSHLGVAEQHAVPGVTVAYHPSMPLLSEESAQYSEVEDNSTIQLPLGCSLPIVEACDVSDQAAQFTEAYQAAAEQVAVSTCVNSGSYQQDLSNVDSLGSAVGSDVLDVSQSNSTETESVPSKPGLPHSMPLLCDDLVYSAEGQQVIEDKSGVNDASAGALEGMPDGHCEGTVADLGSAVVAGDCSSFADVLPVNNDGVIQTEAVDNSGA